LSGTFNWSIESRDIVICNVVNARHLLKNQKGMKGRLPESRVFSRVPSAVASFFNPKFAVVEENNPEISFL